MIPICSPSAKTNFSPPGQEGQVSCSYHRSEFLITLMLWVTTDRSRIFRSSWWDYAPIKSKFWGLANDHWRRTCCRPQAGAHRHFVLSDSPNISKLPRHHDGSTRITNTRSVCSSSLPSRKPLMIVGFFNVPVCGTFVSKSLFPLTIK